LELLVRHEGTNSGSQNEVVSLDGVLVECLGQRFSNQAHIFAPMLRSAAQYAPGEGRLAVSRIGREVM
jgi:hypothetical protein